MTCRDERKPSRLKIEAEARFRELIEAQSGRLLEPYRGTRVAHRIRCRAGHETTAVFASIQRSEGHGICQVCNGRGATARNAARERFAARLVEAGAALLDGEEWRGVRHKMQVRCRAGHVGAVLPADVNRGIGVCGQCAVTSTDRARDAFHALVSGLGGRVVEPSWLGATVPHRIVCRLGHESSPRPRDSRETGGICHVCSPTNPDEARRRFYARLAELGCTLVEPEWLGSKRPHRIICAEGHSAAPRPNNVLNGLGPCRLCMGKVWDLFYVVTNPELARVKFGITSIETRRRLSAHRGRGYREVVRTITGLPTAPQLECAVLDALRLAGKRPVRGREYFDVSALPVILDVVDHWAA